MIQVVSDEMKRRNSYFPEIGHNIGIYTFTPWKEIYPVQLYNREKVAAALDTVPEKGSGPTPLNSGPGEARGRPQATVGQDGRLPVLGR